MERSGSSGGINEGPEASIVQTPNKLDHREAHGEGKKWRSQECEQMNDRK